MYHEWAMSNTRFNDSYKLKYFPSFATGTAGDSLTYHNNSAFSTFDRDNDLGRRSENCAQRWHGAWWYVGCHNSNLNGRYQPNIESAGGMVWIHWTGIKHVGLKEAQMKLRPKSFSP